MTIQRTLILSSFVFIALVAFPSATDAAQNVCQAFTANKSLPSKTAIGTCTGANFGSSQYCEADTSSYNAPDCYPYWNGFGWSVGCVDHWYTSSSYYYGAGPSVAGAGNQSVAYCPYYPNPTASLTASPQTTAYGSTVTLSWSSTNATSCSSSDFNTNNYPSGTAQVTLNSSGSSKTYTVSCTNGVDASVSAQTTVTISNPATPASCTPWDSTKSNSPDFTGSGAEAVESNSAPTPASCAQFCSTYSNSAGKTVTCGLHNYSETFGFGGPSYGGSSGSQTTTASCSATAGSTQYPASSYSYSQTQSAGSGTMDSNDPNYANWLASSGCFGPNPTQTCMVYAFSWSNYGATTCTFTPPAVPPTASLTASPSSIIAGNSSTLTWSSTNANSCTGTNFSTGGATSGSVAVAPGSTTSYSVTCTGDGGTKTASATVSVTPLLSGSCSVSPSSITAGGSATWSASASGGTGAYSYSWSGTDSLAGSGSSVTKTYAAAGTKTASVTITSGSQSKTIACSNNLAVNAAPIPPTGTCSVSPSSIYAGQSATWTVSPGGGNGTYTYSWSGTDSLSGSGSSVTKTYSTTGTKSASVVITSWGLSTTVNCSNSLSVGPAPAADLTAGSVSPTSATAGTQVSLSAAATNTGNATSGSFPILFQVSQTGALIESGYVSALPSGSSGNGAVYYTFPSAGTYQVRACANYNTSWTAIVSESNYANNCGAWTDVVVTNTTNGTCSVSPSSIYTNQSATWTAVPSGGNGSYTYSWSGTDGLTGSGSSVTKAYSTNGAKTATVVITSNGISKTVTCNNSLTVGSAPIPDLTAGSITPTSATAGTAVTLNATVSNTGTANTPAGFTTLFQRATSAGGANATDIGTYVRAALGAASSGTASKSYTFPSAATWYVRACADKSSAGDPGAISESDEGNNCGNWTAVSVVAPPPPTCSLSANPATTVPSTLTWSSSGATSCTGTGFSTGGATSGTKSVTTSGAYLLSCTGAWGTCSDSVTLACTGATATINAAPVRIQAGDTSTVSYSASGADSCTITGPGAPGTVATAACTLAPASFTTPALTTQTTYTITCGAATDSVTINVVPKFENF